MPNNKDDKDIEIIPPDRSQRDGQPEWIRISVEDGRKAFKSLPLHKRILLIASWIAGLIAVAVVVFLIAASVILIWIPLLIAIVLMVGVYVFFRTRLMRR